MDSTLSFSTLVSVFEFYNYFVVFLSVKTDKKFNVQIITCTISMFHKILLHDVKYNAF